MKKAREKAAVVFICVLFLSLLGIKNGNSEEDYRLYFDRKDFYDVEHDCIIQCIDPDEDCCVYYYNFGPAC